MSVKLFLKSFVAPCEFSVTTSCEQNVVAELAEMNCWVTDSIACLSAVVCDDMYIFNWQPSRNKLPSVVSNLSYTSTVNCFRFLGEE